MRPRGFKAVQKQKGYNQIIWKQHMQPTTTTIWLSPTDFVSGDPTLKTRYPSVSSPNTTVTCTSPGDLKWVSVGLRLPQNVKIEEIMVCYQVSNSQSFISQIRLVEMNTPNKATVIHDDGTDLRSTSPICYTSPVGGKVPSPGTAVTLALRLTFQNANDKIMLGAVGVKIDSNGKRCVNTIAEFRALSKDETSCIDLLGYYTPGDGGGGIFYWDSDTSSPDDGGLIIVPNLSPRTGCWKRIFQGFVSVKWFGAKGDGKTDDWNAIQNCIDAVQTRVKTLDTSAAKGQGVGTGFTIYLPTGQYLITETLALADYLTITGDKQAALFSPAPQIVQGIPLSEQGIPLLRIAGRYNKIDGILFGSAKNHIVLYGKGRNGGNIGGPTSGGQVHITVHVPLRQGPINLH